MVQLVHVPRVFFFSVVGSAVGMIAIAGTEVVMPEVSTSSFVAALLLLLLVLWDICYECIAKPVFVVEGVIAWWVWIPCNPSRHCQRPRMRRRLLRSLCCKSMVSPGMSGSVMNLIVVVMKVVLLMVVVVVAVVKVVVEVIVVPVVKVVVEVVVVVV